MERVLSIHVERLPEGLYLATSDDLQGLVAQGRTVIETLEIARDVARRLIEAQEERRPGPSLPAVGEAFDLPLIVAT
jgi:predicted RNase H-like HicB family nuclease